MFVLRRACAHLNITCHPATPHIITSEYSPGLSYIVITLLIFAHILKHGATFRIPQSITVDFPELLNAYAQETILATKAFMDTNFSNAPWAEPWRVQFNQILLAERDACLRRVQQSQARDPSAAHPLSEYKADISKYHPSDADKIAWAQLSKQFFILQTDKATSVYLIVCKHWVLEQIRDDLNKAEFFTAQPITTDTVANNMATYLATRFGIMSKGGIGSYYPTVKLHKPVPCCRFLVGSKG